MTFVVRQFFSSLLGHVQYFSHISAEKVGCQPYFTVFFTYRNSSAKPNISWNFFPAIVLGV